MTCEQIQNDLSLYLYGELGFDAEEAIEQHTVECAACARLLERERNLHAAINTSQAQLPPGLLASCRRQLASQLEITAQTRRTPWWRRLTPSGGHGWWKPMGALAMLAIGFFGGRLWKTEPPSSNGGTPLTATRVRMVEPNAEGGVQIVLEETRQRTVSGALNDEGIRRLLLSAAKDPADPGLRVGSVDLLGRDSAASDVRRALMAAMVSDSNPGVRLKALEGLKPYAADPEVRRSLAQALLRDENPGVRTQAVDLLIQLKQRETVDVLQESMKRENNDYIRLRTQRALREMNASVDSF